MAEMKVGFYGLLRQYSGQPTRISGTLEPTERAAARVLSLPLFSELTTEVTDWVLNAIIKWESQKSDDSL